ncbi:aromatic ring-hydroxylating dioxygenase subunit alpha [Derxia lacustris]|uniref:aromatic ring-hydroxylating dioxygenase subunit alpha n=1 Tax=Derxia lacustris TaxID=764842 RepID=UPI001F238A0B|nr:aromatic ring-hydroxylating dioxygenase subunit alpha [Derxia lacustris]
MLPGCAEYPLNQWYVIAWSDEIAPGKSLARDCCEVPLIVYRSQAGIAHAMFNRCPHRGMMLTSATGRVEGDTVRCGYHGVRLDSNGRCVEVPSGGPLPAKMCVRTYPVVEKWKWLWVWMGDARLADPALIPDHEYLGLENSPMFSEPGIRLSVKANYLMPLENLVDATHITYLHHGLIDSGNVAATPSQLVVDGTRVASVRQFSNELLPPMLCAAMGLKGNRVNRTLTLSAFANHLCEIRQDFVEVGDEHAPPKRINLIVSITPARRTQTDHFALFSTSFQNTHPGRFDDLRNLLMEDVVVLEEIQQLFERLGHAHAPEISIKADEGSIRSRRIIAELIRRERQAEPATAPTHRQPA